ncbi:MAG: PAS domain-containing protein, partial [Alphaproteobacteria bacterium]|nr:PAS domain-containing protein [Alphaproteobacteria bacterium]
MIPSVPPPAWRCALAAVIAIAAAILTRVAVLGLDGGVGATQAFFPAIVLVTLYAGWRWGLAPIVSGAAFAGWLWGGREGHALSEAEIATLVIFLVSGGVIAGVCEGLRGALQGLARARREQNDAELRLQVAQSAAGVGPWDWDIVNDILSLSAEARRNLAAPPHEPVDWPRMLALMHPDDRQMVSDTIRASVRAGDACEVEFRLSDLSQGERWIHARGRMLRDATGRALRMVGVNFDVSDRRRAEQQLRESEARFRSLADSAPALMWMSRPDGRREFVNQAYVDFAGVDYEAALKLDWRSRLDPDDLPQILKGQIVGETSRKPFTLEGRYRRVDGQVRWLKSFSQPRFDPGGVFDGFIGIAF